MNKKTILIVLVLLGLIPAACRKKTQHVPPVTGVSEEKLRTAYGFAAMTPGDAEGFVAVYGLQKLWLDLANSRTGASLRANPLLQQLAGGRGMPAAWAGLSANPEAGAWKKIAGDAFGREVFVILAPGGVERIRALRQLVNETRVQQLKVAVAGLQPGSKARQLDPAGSYLETYRAMGKTLGIPPVILGAKLSGQKAALAAELARAEKYLPAGTEIAAFNLNGNLPFKSVVFSVSKLLSQERQDGLKRTLAAKIPDPRAADEIFQSLMARRCEVAYGFIGDYFVASIGQDHAHLKTCANFQDSLLARPEMAVCAQFADKPLLSLSWAGAGLAGLSRPQYELSPWLERLKPELAGVMPEADVKKLGVDLRRIDGHGARLFPKEAAPLVGVSFRDHGLRSELYGGLKWQAFSADKPLKFSGVPTATTFFWMDARRDPALGTAACAWIEEMTATGYDWFLRFGLPKLPDQRRMGFGVIQNLAVPKLVELYRITRDQFAKSLGQERALALDLGGEIPSLPMIPQAVSATGKLPRLAWMADVQDRGLLGRSWESYLKLAREVARLIPQTAGIPGGLPAPKSEAVNGVTLSYYPLPLPTGDLLPNVAVTDGAMVMSTSPKYSLELAGASAKPLPDSKALAVDLRINPGAAFEFLDKWVALAGDHPEVVFPGRPDKAAEFRKNQPGIVALLQSLRAIGGIEYQVYEENGRRRVSSKIEWQE